MKTRGIVLILFLAFCTFNLSEAAEPNYPTRSVEITVASAPGGGTDLGARAIAEKAKEFLGQEFVVINKSGGGHRVTLTLLSKAKPDGYTLGGVTDSVTVLSPHIEKISYKPLDYTFLCQYGTLDFGTFVLPDSPFKTWKDMIDFARANPNKLSIGVTEVNSANHLALMALCQMENLKINFVPFMGAAPTTLALMGRHVMVASSAESGFARQVRAKQVRLLSMMSDERMEEYPDVPTLKELGYPSLVLQSWYLMLGPNNMDKMIAKKLEDTFRKAMESPSFIKIAKEIGIYVKKPLFGDELRETEARRLANNEKLIKGLGLKLE